MSDLIHLSFFQTAVLTGVLLSVLYGCLSFFVVSKKLVFMGAGIAHTAFGGVALGILLSINPFYTALIFCVCAAVILGFMVRRTDISYDAGIGIFFSFAMALGAILIALRKAYTFDLTGYLFGNILGVTVFDLLMVAVITGLFLGYIAFFMHRILFVSFDKQVAAISGVPSNLIEMSLLIFMAVIIVVSIKMIGIVLVSALIVLPASFGKLFFQNYRGVISAGIVYMLFITLCGIYLAYAMDTPIGATIVVLGTAVYIIGLSIASIVQRA